MNNFIVTAHVNKLGRRAIISQRLSREKAICFKYTLENDLSLAIDRYKWADNIQVEPV